MKGEIIDYLTLKHMEDPNFEAPMMQRVRTAWMLAEKIYASLTEREIKEFSKKIIDERRRRTS